MKQKNLILIEYPSTDFESVKIRPALIISNDKLNIMSEDCIMVPLTTIMKDLPYSIIIQPNDLESGKLIKTSRIRIDRITSIKKDLIIKKIGVLNNKQFFNVKKEIKNLF
ncbi:hypothetical protein CL616_02505 [archaeon]|nr:hypothetical protein [archaeon]